jgi:hypothetical protein
MSVKTYHAFQPLAVGGENSITVHGDGTRVAVTIVQDGQRAYWVTDRDGVRDLCDALMAATEVQP